MVILLLAGTVESYGLTQIWLKGRNSQLKTSVKIRALLIAYKAITKGYDGNGSVYFCMPFKPNSIRSLILNLVFKNE